MKLHKILQDKFMKLSNKKILVISGLILLAIVERLWIDMGDNVELVTLATFVTAFYIHRRVAIFVAVFLMALTDAVIGNTSIAIFTWSAFLTTSLIAVFSSHKATTTFRKTFTFIGGGISSSVFFYLWTNFGVWYMDKWGMYADNLHGLYRSYLMGLPFFKAHLLSNIVILSVVLGLIETYNYILQSKLEKSLKLSGTR